MAKQKEASFRDRAMKFIRALPNTWSVRIEQQSVHGTPDCLICMNGSFVAIEFKRSEKAPITALQTYTLEKISLAKGAAFIACPENWEIIASVLLQFAHGEVDLKTIQDTVS